MLCGHDGGEEEGLPVAEAAFLVVHWPLHPLGLAKAFDVAKRGLTVIPPWFEGYS